MNSIDQSSQTIPVFEDVFIAHERIKPYIHKTPILTSRRLNALTGAKLFFKCENLQKAGAFKVRGATNAVFSLSDTEASLGVATHSSGNHACLYLTLLANAVFPLRSLCLTQHHKQKKTQYWVTAVKS